MFGVCPLKFRVTWGIMIGKITSPMSTTLMFMVTYPYARGCVGMHPVMIRVTFSTIVGDIMCGTLMLTVIRPYELERRCLGCAP